MPRCYEEGVRNGSATKLPVQRHRIQEQDETSKDRLRSREERERRDSTLRGRKKIKKKPPRREVLIFNSENQRNVFLPEGLGLFPT